MRGSLRHLVFVSGIFIAAAALAQTPPMSPEARSNVVTSGSQFEPAAASDESGRFVIVWTTYGQDGNFFGIFGRRFDASGAPLAGEFQVNTYTPGAQGEPDVGMDADGNFAAVWRRETGSNTSGIAARRFDSAGAPLGDEFIVNAAGSGPRLSMNSAGTFVVVWTANQQPGEEYGGIRARRYNSAGNPLGDAFQVNTYTTGNQYSPSVAMAPNGSFIVTWSDSGNLQGDRDGDDTGVFGQRFDAAGALQGSDFQVTTTTSGRQRDSEVAVDADGDFVVTWSDNDGDLLDVRAQRFDATGNELGPEFLVNSYTTGAQYAPDVAMHPDGDFLVSWFGGTGRGLSAQRFDAAGARRGTEFDPDPVNRGNRSTLAAHAAGRFAIAWTAPDGTVPNSGVYARAGGFPEAGAMSVDERGPDSLSGSEAPAVSNLNGVLEIGELVAVDTAWGNPLEDDLDLSGSAADLTGPAGPVYEFADDAADYGTIATGPPVDCFTATANCYAVEITGTRPAGHVDATFEEELSNDVTKTWALHVGESFPDVPLANPFYPFIENIFHNGITGGCAGGGYCPTNPVTRAQMAVFLLKAKYGAAHVPLPCTGTVFTDVPCLAGPFDPWIEQLAGLGITGGCGPGLYCPNNTVTRQQMAVFLLKAEEGSTYLPPACTQVFNDVPCTPGTGFSDWIVELAGRGITGGCSVSPPLYCPGNPNNRGQMAVFLVKTFGLLLYGP